jgi:hypothetical protein
MLEHFVHQYAIETAFGKRNTSVRRVTKFKSFAINPALLRGYYAIRLDIHTGRRGGAERLQRRRITSIGASEVKPPALQQPMPL